MSGFFGSTAIFSKYQPRPHSAWSALTRRHVAPASSERNTPPCPGGGGEGRPGTGGWGLGAGAALRDRKGQRLNSSKSQNPYPASSLKNKNLRRDQVDFCP